MVTKGGTNRSTANVVEFIRNDVLRRAALTSCRPTSAPRPPLRQNQFGFELDGPVIIPKIYNGRDKTFFMGSYERLRGRAARRPQHRDPDGADVRRGFLADPDVGQGSANNNTPFPGNIVPTSLLSPIALALQQYYPKPTILPGSRKNFTCHLSANNNNTDQTVDRMDQNIGDTARVVLPLSAAEAEHRDTAPPIRTTPPTVPSITDNYTVGYTQTITPTMVNDFRIGRQLLQHRHAQLFFRKRNRRLPEPSSGFPASTPTSRAKIRGLPSSTSAAFPDGAISGTNWFQTDHTWQASEQISWNRRQPQHHGRRRVPQARTPSRSAANSPRGVFNFTASTRAMRRRISCWATCKTWSPRPMQYQGADWSPNGAMDSSCSTTGRSSRKLTINYGLRYELQTVPYSVAGNAPRVECATRPRPCRTRFPCRASSFHDPNHKDWAPRLGLAYRMNEQDRVPRRRRDLLQPEPDQQLHVPDHESAVRAIPPPALVGFDDADDLAVESRSAPACNVRRAYAELDHRQLESAAGHA